MPLIVSPTLTIPDEALSVRFIRAGGPGGQNVNKVATAVQLRFEPKLCLQLHEAARMRLRTLAGRRMTDADVLMITAQRFRTQEQNRRDAFERLKDLVQRSLVAPKPRRATRPTRASKERRLRSKEERGQTKKLRARVGRED